MKRQIRLLINFINNPGSVIRIALILERRGFTLQSMKITDELFRLSVMELKVEGDSIKKEQIIKQIEKLVDVKSVEALDIIESPEINGRKEIFALSGS